MVDFDELTPIVLKNKIEALLYGKISNVATENTYISELSWDVIAEKLYRCIED